MMPRRNHPSRRRRTVAYGTRHTVYLRDACGKLAFPTYEIARRMAGRADADHDLRGLDDHHSIYRCRFSGGWHLSGRTPSEVDSRRAYFHHHEEATR